MQLTSKLKIVCLSAVLMSLSPNLAIAEPVGFSDEVIGFQEYQNKNISNISSLIIEHSKQLEYERQLEIERELQEKLELEKQKLEQERLLRLQEKEKQFNYFISNIKTKEQTKQFDLTNKSGISVEDAEFILKGTGLEGLGKYFVAAERKYGVNAVYLMAHAAQESGWATSPISISKNNLFGFQAYDKSPTKSSRSFSSKAECIDVVAAYISEHYLNSNGDYYNGPTLAGMNIKYASDDEWSDNIASIMKSLTNEIINK